MTHSKASEGASDAVNAIGATGPRAAIGLPPRALTPRIRRRAWVEPRARFWTVTAVVLLVIGVCLIVSSYLQWKQAAELVRSGTVVSATVIEANEGNLKGKQTPGDVPVKLEYEWEGKTYQVASASLDGRSPEDFIVIGSTLPIRIDPKDPLRWTPRTAPAALSHELIGGFIALAVGALLLIPGFWMRANVRRTWRDGNLIEGLVVSARHTAIAPRAWTVQCTPADTRDSRVFTVFAPADTDVSEGASLQLLANPRGGRMMSADWFRPACTENSER